MLLGAKFSSLKCESAPLKDYKDFLKCIKCKVPKEKCHLMTCSKCPGTEKLQEVLQKYFEDNLIDYITYQQRMTVD